ncbi:unnamed protein product [Calypogeia fissa]
MGKRRVGEPDRRMDGLEQKASSSGGEQKDATEHSIGRAEHTTTLAPGRPLGGFRKLGFWDGGFERERAAYLVTTIRQIGLGSVRNLRKSSYARGKRDIHTVRDVEVSAAEVIVAEGYELGRPLLVMLRRNGVELPYLKRDSCYDLMYRKFVERRALQ